MIIEGLVAALLVTVLGLTRAVYKLAGQENGISKRLNFMEKQFLWIVDVIYQQARSDPNITIRPPPDTSEIDE